MIQTRQQLVSTCDEYNSLFSKNEFYPLQKAYSTPHFLVFSIRFPGKSIVLYIGRGNQYQGIFLSDKLPPSYLRVQDRLLDYIRKYLVGTRPGKIELDVKNQLWSFPFKNEHINNSMLFGYKERQLFFAKQSLEEAYISWTGEMINSGHLSQAVKKLCPDQAVEQEALSIWGIDDYLKEEEKKISGRPLQKKKEKFLIKKITNISRDLNQSQTWILIEEDLLSNRIDLNLDEVNIYGQKFKMHGLPSLWAKRDLVFKKIKKLKRAECILKGRLEDAQNELEKVKVGDFEFEVTKEKVIQPLWAKHTKLAKTEKTEFNIKNFSINKVSGVLGLDAYANDHIRSISSKEHYWFHIENYPGAHCIVKTEDLGLLSQDFLAAIASMLRDYSKLEMLEIPVLFTQVKNLKGVKGVKGEVIVKKPKYLRCIYQNWKEIISIG